MRQVGAFEAKTHFSELLKAVEEGERIIIKRRGHTVALLIPASKVEESMATTVDTINTIKRIRKGVSLGKKLSIDEMKSMGRK